jgi:hypothetical protein
LRINARFFSLTDPYPVGFSVFDLHDLNYLFGRCDINPVAVEDFKGYGQPLPHCHQTDTDLWAIRMAVTAVTPLGLGIAFGGSFKVGRGDVIEQLAVAFLQMEAQCILVRKQHIQSPLEPAFVYLVFGNTQNVVRCSLAVLKLGNLQF